MKKVEPEIKKPDPNEILYPVKTIMVGKVRMHIYNIGKIHYLRFTYQDGRIRCTRDDILKHGVRFEDAMAVVGCAMSTVVMESRQAEKDQEKIFQALSARSLQKMINQSFESMDKAKGRLGAKFEKEIGLKVKRGKRGKYKKRDSKKL